MEKSYTKKYMRHLGPLSLKHDRKIELGFRRCSTTRGTSCATNSKVPNQTNQFQIQIMIERGNPLLEPIDRCNPLLELTREPCKMEEERPVLRRSKHFLFTKKLSNMIERSNPLWKRVATQTRSSDGSKSLNVEMAHDITEQPVVSCHTNDVPDGCQTCSCHERISFNVGDETIHDRTGQPVVNRDGSGDEQTMLNEVNMDFRIPGLPHSVVNHAESSRVRELIVKKIENHPDRYALQQDLQQNKAHNPFSATAKKMIQEVGNEELFELIETDPKTQCKACLSYWME